MNGANQKVSYTDTAFVTGRTALYASAFVTVNAFSGGDGTVQTETVLSFGDSANYYSVGVTSAMMPAAMARNARVGFASATLLPQNQPWSMTPLAPSTWTHVALRLSSSGTISVFKDGECVMSVAAGPQPWMSGTEGAGYFSVGAVRNLSPYVSVLRVDQLIFDIADVTNDDVAAHAFVDPLANNILLTWDNYAAHQQSGVSVLQITANLYNANGDLAISTNSPDIFGTKTYTLSVHPSSAPGVAIASGSTCTSTGPVCTFSAVITVPGPTYTPVNLVATMTKGTLGCARSVASATPLPLGTVFVPQVATRLNIVWTAPSSVVHAAALTGLPLLNVQVLDAVGDLITFGADAATVVRLSIVGCQGILAPVSGSAADSAATARAAVAGVATFNTTSLAILLRQAAPATCQVLASASAMNPLAFGGTDAQAEWQFLLSASSTNITVTSPSALSDSSLASLAVSDDLLGQGGSPFVSASLAYPRPRAIDYTASTTGVLQGTPMIGASTATFGRSIAVSANGETIVAGAPGENSLAGSTFVFMRDPATGNFIQTGKLVGTGSVGAANQGSGVAISGDGLFIATAGPRDNADEGRVWVFSRAKARIGSPWTEHSSVAPSDVTVPVPPTNFGNCMISLNHIGRGSVALSYDASTLAVGGCTDSGSMGGVWVYRRSGATWGSAAFLKGTGASPPKLSFQYQGTAVAVSADGDLLVSTSMSDKGGPAVNNSGAFWVFRYLYGAWTQIGAKYVHPTSSAARMGISVAMSGDGRVIVLGAYSDTSGVGAAYVFVRSGAGRNDTYVASSVLRGTPTTGSPALGGSVAISYTGDVIVAGAPMNGGSASSAAEGGIFVFQRDPETDLWSQSLSTLGKTTFSFDQAQGASVDLSADGTVLAQSAPYEGSGSYLATTGPGYLRVHRLMGRSFARTSKTSVDFVQAACNTAGCSMAIHVGPGLSALGTRYAPLELSGPYTDRVLTARHLPIDTGYNTIRVIVTSPDRTTTTTYAVRLFRDTAPTADVYCGDTYSSSATCVRTRGVAYCAGDNTNGQLGNGGTTTTGNTLGAFLGISALTFAGNNQPVHMSLGNLHTCALLKNAQSVCWGDGSSGAIASQAATDVLSSSGAPVALDEDPTVLSVDASDASTCFAKAPSYIRDGTRGSARCFGVNANGRLGRDNLLGSGSSAGSVFGNANAAINFNLAGPAYVTQVTTNLFSACALWTHGRIACWGYFESAVTDYTSRGEGPGVSSVTNVKFFVFSDTQPAVDVQLAGRSGCALFVPPASTIMSGYLIRCWGNGGYGALGRDNASGTYAFTALTLISYVTFAEPTRGVLKYVGGTHMGCAIFAPAEFGRIKCWGENLGGVINANIGTDYGLSAGDMTNLEYMTFAAPVGFSPAYSIGIASRRACASFAPAVDTLNPLVHCWGQNYADGSSGVSAAGNFPPASSQAFPLVAQLTTQAKTVTRQPTLITDDLGFFAAHGGFRPDQTAYGSTMWNLTYTAAATVNITVYAPDAGQIWCNPPSGPAFTTSPASCLMSTTATPLPNVQIYDSTNSTSLAYSFALAQYPAASTVSTLKSLRDSAGAVTSFSPATTLYGSAWVNSDVASVEVVAACSTQRCSATANGVAMAAITRYAYPYITPSYPYTLAGSVNLTAGATTAISVVVTAENGVGKTTYQFTVGRRALTCAPVPRMAVRVGSTHVVAVPNGAGVLAWGQNLGGNLGRGTVAALQIGLAATDMSSLQFVSFSDGYSTPTLAVSLQAETLATCALNLNGTIRCYGPLRLGASGAWSSITAGSAPTGASSVTSQPALQFGTTHTAVALSTAGSSESYSVCAVFSNGGLRCWGYGLAGVAGTGGLYASTDLSTADKARTLNGVSGLTAIPFIAWPEGPTLTVTAVATGLKHNCALFVNGKVRCWGSPIASGLGIVPAQPAGIGANMRVYRGQTGGLSWANSLPFLSFSDTFPVTGLSAGGMVTCLIFGGAPAFLRCFGRCSDGMCGTPSFAENTVPSAVGRDDPVNTQNIVPNGPGGLLTLAPMVFSDTAPVVSVSVSSLINNVCATFGGGRVRCWGDNQFGQTGFGFTSLAFLADLPSHDYAWNGRMGGIYMPSDPFQAHYWTSVSVNGGAVCATSSQAIVSCWGRGSDGRLGRYTSASSSNVVSTASMNTEVVSLRGYDHDPSIVDLFDTTNPAGFALVPAWCPHTTVYTLFTASPSLNLTAVLASPLATATAVTVTGSFFSGFAPPGVPGVTVPGRMHVFSTPLSLSPILGSTGVITIGVTASGGFAKRTYQITVTAGSTVATLKNLTDSLSVSAGFAANVTAYGAPRKVTFATTSLALVTATATDPLASVKINANAATPGASSASNVALAPGLNTVTVVVTATDLTTKMTYTLSILRMSNNSAVTALTDSFGISTAAFSPAVLSYGAPFQTSAAVLANVTVTCADPGCAVTAGGVPSSTNVAGFAVVNSVPLAIGTNLVPVVVMSQDGSSTTTYTLSIRRRSPDGSLVALSDDLGVVPQPFNGTSGSSWAATVPSATTSVTLNAACGYPSGCSILIGSGAAASGANATRALAAGLNSIQVRVTSEDGTATTTVTVAITRLSGDSTLASFTGPAGAVLSPTFNPANLTYTLTLPAGTTSFAYAAACGAPATCGKVFSATGGATALATLVSGLTPGSPATLRITVSAGDPAVPTTVYTFALVIPSLGPVVTCITAPPAVVPGQSVVTLTGSGFGASAGLVANVTVAGSPCGAVVYLSPTSLTCVVSASLAAPSVAPPTVSVGLTSGAASPAGAPALTCIQPTGVFNVTVPPPPPAASASGTPIGLTPPLVTALAPSAGPNSGGTRVTLYGAFLGLAAGDLLAVAVGADCSLSKAYISSSAVSCVTAPSASLGFAPVSVRTSGGTSPAGISFFFTYPAPTISLVNPRVLPASAAVAPPTLTLRGAFFGSSAAVSLMVMVGSSPCINAMWVSETECTCVAPPNPDPSGAPSAAAVPVVVVVDGKASPPANVGFQLKYGQACVPTCDWTRECVLGSCGGCLAGFTGPACSDLLVTLLVPADRTTNRDGKSVTLTLKLGQAVASSSSFTVVSSDPTAATVSPARVTFDPSGPLSQAITVKGAASLARTGPVGYLVTVAADPAASLPEHGAVPLAPVQLVNFDSAPKLASFSPKAAPYLGTNMTLTGASWDYEVVVTLGAPVSANVSRSLIQRLAYGEINGGVDALVFTAPPVNQTGYVPITVTNLDGAAATAATFLYYTEDCLGENMYGKGTSCRPCPKVGAVCPGGNRIWPTAGFWNPGESSGYVVACDPPEACLGGQEGTACAKGYKGSQCRECIVGYHPENGACVPCPSKGSTTLKLALLIVFWTLFAMCVAFVRDRMTLSYIVMVVKALQTLGGIGSSSTSKLPRWLLSIYSALSVVSGDFSFMNVDCMSPMPFFATFWYSLLYQAAIYLPILIFLPMVRALLVSRAIARGDSQEQMTALYCYFKDRLVRGGFIWASMVYLALTSLAMEALSCLPVRGTDGVTRYHMITKGELCYQGNHNILVAMSVLILLGFSVGFPVAVILKIKNNPDKRVTVERFMERFDFFYEFYNKKEAYVWCLDFLASIIVASGKSFLRPHVNYQMTASVIVFGFKVVYIIARRPYIDWLTDVIQGILAMVSLVAVNINFFERRGISAKIPNFSTAMALLMFAFFGVTIVVLIIIIILLFVKGPKPKPEAAAPSAEEVELDSEELEYLRASISAANAAAAAGDTGFFSSLFSSADGADASGAQQEKGFLDGISSIFSSVFGESTPPAVGAPAEGTNVMASLPNSLPDSNTLEEQVAEAPAAPGT